VDAELARAMRLFATRHLRERLGAGRSEGPTDETRSVQLPVATMRAVENLVGADQVAAFVTAAVEREVQARTLDNLTSNYNNHSVVDEIP
jgi:hypothetical protein